MARWQFTDYRVNQALEPSDFRLQFPDDIIPHRRPDDLRAGDEPSDGAESRQRPAE